MEAWAQLGNPFRGRGSGRAAGGAHTLPPRPRLGGAASSARLSLLSLAASDACCAYPLLCVCWVAVVAAGQRQVDASTGVPVEGSSVAALASDAAAAAAEHSGSPQAPTVRTTTSPPARSALLLLRWLCDYAGLMPLLPAAQPALWGAMAELFDNFLLACFILFGSTSLQDLAWRDGCLPTRLRNALLRITTSAGCKYKAEVCACVLGCAVACRARRHSGWMPHPPAAAAVHGACVYCPLLTDGGACAHQAGTRGVSWRQCGWRVGCCSWCAQAGCLHAHVQGHSGGPDQHRPVAAAARGRRHPAPRNPRAAAILAAAKQAVAQAPDGAAASSAAVTAAASAAGRGTAQQQQRPGRRCGCGSAHGACPASHQRTAGHRPAPARRGHRVPERAG
jgi:hypothetical protein